MSTVAFTGHRWPKFQASVQIRNALEFELKQHNAELCISGMAIGFDQFAAKVCSSLQIPWIAAIPFKGQEKLWPKQIQEEYRMLLSFAREIVVVSPGGYSAGKMHRRNEWMLDRADLVIAYWDGSLGGTAGAIRYAQNIQKPVINIYPGGGS